MSAALLRTLTKSQSSLALGKRLLSTTRIDMAAKQEWMIILPDNAGALQKRMEIRPQHLENLKPLITSGTVLLGGASLDQPLKDGEGPQINGSVMLVAADSREDAMKLAESDIYYKENVWDMSKVQIFPFKSAVRQAL